MFTYLLITLRGDQPGSPRDFLPDIYIYTHTRATDARDYCQAGGEKERERESEGDYRGGNRGSKDETSIRSFKGKVAGSLWMSKQRYSSFFLTATP